MDRITRKHLDALVARINTVMGTPAEPYRRREDDSGVIANVGNYHISGAYGGWCLHQMVNEGGGVRSVFGVGHVPARQLYDQMQAYMRGIEDGRARK